MSWGRKALRELCADVGLKPKVLPLCPRAPSPKPRKRGWRTGVSRREHDLQRLEAHTAAMREEYGAILDEEERHRERLILALQVEMQAPRLKA